MYNICLMGLGKIAPRIINGIRHSKGHLYALASRDINKSRRLCQEYGVENALTYEMMLEDQNIDIVYIATPNYLHYEHALKCLNAHKNVIVEKPIFTNEKELELCFKLANDNNLLLMEAHKGLFTPLIKKIKGLIDEGVIGDLKMIEAQDASNLKGRYDLLSAWSKDKAGAGCLFDIGVYPIALENFLSSSKIKDYQLDLKNEQSFVTFAQGQIIYENGIRAHFLTSWESDGENCAHIYGTKGSIHIHNFWKNTKAKLLKDGCEETIEVSMASDFSGEIDHFIDCLDQGLRQSPIMSKEASLEILKLLR